ncbi:MAG: hypothetical protein V5A34_05600 [Halapricum sp.]
MSSLASSFEADLRDAVLDDVEQAARNTLAEQFAVRAGGRLLEYGRTHDYNVEPIIEAAESDVERRGDMVVVRWGWPKPAIWFEYGTSDHTITPTDADVLSFVWEDPPQWVREEFDRARDASGRFSSGWRVFFPSVDVDGLPESRFIRDTLRWLEQELRS